MRSPEQTLTKRFKRALFLNQMAGPLFLEHAEGIAAVFEQNSILHTGHPDTLGKGSECSRLQVSPAPGYDRTSLFRRAFSWLRYTIFAFQKVICAKSDDLIVFCSNPPLLSFVGAAALQLRPLNFVTIVHDIYPDTLTRFTKIKETFPLVLVWTAVNHFFYQNNISVQTLSPGMAKTLANQFQSVRNPPKAVQVVFPWADPNFIKPLEKTKNPLAKKLEQVGKTTVLYSGNLGISHDIDSMLQAALILREHKDINFLFIGEGEKWKDANEFQKKHELDTVKVLPFQPQEVLPHSLALADIALVSMEKEAEGLMVPSKTFYNMAAGAAIIGLCTPGSDLARIIKIADCGLSLASGSPIQLAMKILELHRNPESLKNLKVNASQATLIRFSKETSISKSIEAISNSLESRCESIQIL